MYTRLKLFQSDILGKKRKIQDYHLLYIDGISVPRTIFLRTKYNENCK